MNSQPTLHSIMLRFLNANEELENSDKSFIQTNAKRLTNCLKFVKLCKNKKNLLQITF